MIIESIIRDEADTIDLIEHRSDINMKLQQIETGKIYGAVVIDAIPCLFSYKETDEQDISEEE